MLKANRMPTIFIGHGSPMNAIEENEFNQTWRKIGQSIPRPKAILSISAHWETHETAITGSLTPQTIHDFMGFPSELFEAQYPAAGSQWLVDIFKKQFPEIMIDQQWGFDHGTWSVLLPMYPAADIPVVQLSLSRSLDLEGHYALGRALRPLRDEGVLILGSGNLVHNLRLAVYQEAAFDWAVEYDAQVKDWITAGNHEDIIHYQKFGRSAELAVNSEEHYLPLLYVLGASEKQETIEFFCEKVTMGSISMRCVQFG